MARQEQAEKCLKALIASLDQLGFLVEFIHIDFYDSELKKPGHMNSTAEYEK